MRCPGSPGPCEEEGWVRPSWLFPTFFCCPSHPLPGQGTGIRTGWASHAGRGRAPGPLRLTGRSWWPQPPGSHSRRQRSCPCNGPGPGPPATRPRSQRRGRWRRHGPPGAWEAWGAEKQWSVDSRDLGPRPRHSPEERPSEKGQEKGKMTEPYDRPGSHRALGILRAGEGSRCSGWQRVSCIGAR